MTTLTAKQLIDMMEKAVEKKGEDFRYNPAGSASGGCFYFPEPAASDLVKRETGCLFGTMLADAGLLRREDGYAQPSMMIRGLLERLGITVVGVSVKVLSRIQVMQDEGETWGTCLLELKEAVARESFDLSV